MSIDSVNIKGTKHGLIILMDGSCSLTELREQLHKKLEKNKGFFGGARFTIHIIGEELNPEILEEFQSYCVSLGMVYDPEIPYFNNQIAAAADNLAVNVVSLEPRVLPEPMPVRPESPPSDNTLPIIGLTGNEGEQQSLMIDHNLRSGQKVVFPGNIIVLGDVNPGAEIIASGNIVVMGTLRGIAHAGASGDSSSTIVAYNLEPTQIRIGERIGRSPDQSTGAQTLAPEIARLTDGQICIERLGSQGSHRKSSR